MTQASPNKATLTRCTSANGGLIIGWDAPNKLIWRLVVDRIKMLPKQNRYYLSEQSAWWIDSVAFFQIADCFDNAEASLDAANRGLLPTLITASAKPTMTASIAIAFRILHLKPSAPLALIDAAVKILSEQERDPRRVLTIHQMGDHARAWASRKAVA